ncbi:FliA/WhiG subfamily RNA polymerase sigma-28 subunit [Thermincola ferriacetica]|nr:MULTISPECIES: RNA polymerase sporulation sigma factor SigK [Thermincola]KNZ70975.1 FliA/WhiG subfamily RNA polymerase sigma-28 subunit [Thermincola ferriacetica]
MVSGLWTAIALGALNALLLLVSYISNNTFPQPLSEEEEQKYLELLEKGDEEARNVLIERNLRLVAHIVKKFDGALDDNDDLISIGTIGLIKAINTFNRYKGTRLATYAARCIENEILMHLRATKKNRVEVSLYDSIGVDKEGNEITLIDVLGTESEIVLDTVESLFEQRRLLEKVKKLSYREKNVLQLRFGLVNGIRKTQREIARKLGISRSYVSRIEKRALNKLTKDFKAEGCQ